ncbi:MULTISPECIES: hypothetical protein [Enterobacterales]|uniref:hypothetical protein n=1 Tax=Enterobacterales TaxID=91347 RepID=UPI002ED82921
MFKSLKSLWEKAPEKGVENDLQAQQLSEEIAELEARLEKDPRDSEAQKQLMLTYNRALKVYASSQRYRSQVDTLFEQIDALRNVIRRNI